MNSNSYSLKRTSAIPEKQTPILRQRRTGALTFLALLALAGGTLHAQTSWNTTSSGNWNTASNWSPATVPNSAGGAVTVSKSFGANSTITLDISPTVGTMSVGSTSSRSLSFKSSSTQTLTFDNSGSTAQLTYVSTAGNNTYFYCPIILNGSLNIINNNSRILYFYQSGATVTGNSASDMTITVSGTGTTGVSFQGIVSDGTAGGKVNLVQSSSTCPTILPAANTYSGNTTITAGTLTLSSTGSINNSPLISIAAGGTFDVSAIASYTLSASTTLAASGHGTGAQATIKGGTTVSLGAQPITLTWGGGTSGTDSTHPCLVVSPGALTLNNNAITVNGSLLGNGIYTLISVTGGTINQNGSPSYAVGGSAIDITKTNLVSVSGGSVILTVSAGSSTPTITAPPTLPGSLATTYGTASGSQSVAVSGASLGADITATAQTGFQVSIDDATYGPTATFPQSGGNASGTLYVRLAATASAAGSYNGVTAAILSSGSATPVNVATTSSGNTVSQASPTVTVTVGTYTYNGSVQGPNAYTTSPSGDTGTATWSYAGTGSTTYGPSPTRPIAAGTYSATVSLTADSNFYAAASGATAFTIGSATPTVTVTVVAYYYDGNPQGPTAYTTSPVGDTGTPTWSYQGTGSTSYGPISALPTAPGTYSATVSLAADNNFNAASSSATAFTINAGVITVTGTLTNFVTDYGTASPAQSVSVSGTNLTSDITATAPSGFEVSANGSTYAGTATFPQSGGNAGGTLYVRLAATAPVASYSVNVALTSTGALPVNIPATGTVNALYGDGTWTLNGDGNWSTAANWLNSRIADGQGKTAGITYNITGNHTLTMDTTARTLGILNLGDSDNTNSYTLAATGGATLTFDNGGSHAHLNQVSTSKGDTLDNTLPVLLSGSLDIANASANPLAVAGTITPTSTGALTLSNLGGGAGAVTLSGNITDGSGTVAILQNSGTSALVLAGAANGYSGGAIISAGTLQFNSAAAIGGSGRNVTASAGTAVAAGYAINNAFLNRMTENGNAFAVALGAASGNALDFSSSTGATLPNASLGAVGAFTYSGTLTPNGTTYRLGGGGGTLTVSSSTLTGMNSLAVTGPGTVALSGTNNYSGATTVNSGTLQLASASALSGMSRTVTINATGAVTASGIANVYAGCAFTLNGGTLRFNASPLGNTNPSPISTTAVGGDILVNADSTLNVYDSRQGRYYNLIQFGKLDFAAADPVANPDGYKLENTTLGQTISYQPSRTYTRFVGSTISNSGWLYLNRINSAEGYDQNTYLDNTVIRAGKTLKITDNSGFAIAQLENSLGVGMLGGAEVLGASTVTMIDASSLSLGTTFVDNSTFDSTNGLWSKSGTTTLTATLTNSVGSIAGAGGATFAATNAAYVSLTGLTVANNYKLTLTLANAGDQATVLAQLAKNPAFSNIAAVGGDKVSLQFTATAATHCFAWDNVHTAAANWHLGGNLTAVALNIVGGTPYEIWTGGPFLGTLTDPNPAHDSDGGGLPTGIEWVTGGDPTNPADDASVTPTLDNTSDPYYFIFTYRRTNAAYTDPNTTITVEYGSNLGSWTTAVDDGFDIITTTTIGGGGAGIDLVHVKISRTFAVGGKLFARLNVVVTVP